jgi:hypothetical protein
LSGQTYLITIARGEIGREELAEIFGKAAELCASVPACKVLVDLEAATLRLEPADLDSVFKSLRAGLEGHAKQVAIVAAPQEGLSRRLNSLHNSQGCSGLNFAVFDDTRSAVAWLSGGP